MNHDRVLAALLFVLVPCLALNWKASPSPAFADILARLRHECDPANPEADYNWSQSSLPTERKREVIIADCRRLGATLLPEVRRQTAMETDEELRGMLIIIAAALGDKAAVEQAARQMAWSDYPAVRISAAKTLRRLRDHRTINWFLTALQDGHFVINGGCGLQREQFYPVRCIAQIALREMLGDQYPGDAELLLISQYVYGNRTSGSLEELLRFGELMDQRASWR